MNLSHLFCYPLKGCKGLSLSEAQLTPLGIIGDRRLVIVDAKGRFVNGKKYPQLALVECEFDGSDFVRFTAPDMPELIVSMSQTKSRELVSIWRSQVDAAGLGGEADQWISRFLEGVFHVCFYDQHSKRQVNRRPEYPVSFADSAPLLIVSQQSLDALNRYSGRQDQLIQFRPNLVIEADQPFAEESWKKIQIGDVVLESVKSCARCPVITVDSKSARPDPNGEPLKSLAKLHRRVDDGQVIFGQYFVVSHPGSVAVGETVTVLEKQSVAAYQPVPETVTVSERSTPYLVTFEPMTLQVQGQTDQSLLEIAEEAGVDLPSSCRQGSCGCCRVKRIQGEVESVADYALSEDELAQGYVLACSCYPRSDVVISLDD
ncbi:YcbX family protein [Celerinatantimonas sp. YJH-8]|uniref:YcbX family protein n=1 Tax=Celerinatantimonas sp. YJH-8 TaxID=3228714 RepID=UPI0038C9B995